MSWKFNPFTGKLDYFEDQATVDEAKRLSDEKVCGENISALQLVRAISETEIVVAEPDTFVESKVLGIALQSGLVGASIQVLLFGKIEDAFFTFPINQPLFLKTSGAITDVAPVLPSEVFSTNIGYSLGAGAIFISINDPIEL